MSRALFALILLGTVTLINSAQQCPPDQVWNDCGSPCKTYCLFRAYTDHPACATDGSAPCIPQCQCKPGYFFNNQVKCVKEEQCEGGLHPCKENQVWNECATPCKTYCLFRPYTDHPACATDGSAPCIRQCQCKPGYFFNNKVQCVKEEQCEGGLHPCKEEQEWTECGSLCKMYCSFRNSTNLAVCATNGTGLCINHCQCKNGYFFNEKNQCVREDQCEQ